MLFFVEGYVDLYKLFLELVVCGVNEVLVEVGLCLVGVFVWLGLVDEYWLFVVLKFFGFSVCFLFDWLLVWMVDVV